MRVKAITLGTTHPSALSLYMIPIQDNQPLDFFSLDDLRYIFTIIHSPTSEEIHSITRLVQSSPESICTDQNGHIYLQSQLVIAIACRLQLYALAELCRLSHKDLLAGTANPLLQSLSFTLKPNTHPHITEHTLILDWSITDATLSHLAHLFIEQHHISSDDGEFTQESVSDTEQTLLEW
ncbi:hypothetical protein PHYBLDRAFT_150953 [Phycomyces blakesleeanus NRRL 1555(-)]|uniref:Uncharacterized protein n=1 Tax=Phycomyces blakesleeanus (strain ATCC 8743b / DSM 1359 / FGSC 10004 / NBRC 33097 / NRRL 1555) TaxID=763407 RepID=A0A162ZMN8_PHYB8|nr:hypothetical protein PHYBLDRAFT_150953 [Phycomyces blakesleeanus NRRL 1555(-)]OAD67871.1 hypothetical protein PHYBLDRAFT_150953 [Phycomyces blakesleeanus NRRL 1555(-)]|eukprot:XP_018285911.1 hypothetical protein PHYBLDRAFT_150953 [Phycomyces blakesleeanus NRRL 1555(-)]